ncbi:MAG: hypothetical protein PVJ76_08510 [Gemmatimonadota bacterium]
MPRAGRVTSGALVLLFSAFSHLPAQVEPPEPATGEPVRFYMDCRASGCDEDFIRTEILFVNHVRDIQDSDVYLLATSQSTGAGGRSAELIFQGRGRFEGMTDTLTFVSAYDATSAETRESLTRLIKIGLMRFVGLTPMADRIEIGLTKPQLSGPGRPPGGPGPTVAPEDDPWDFWVFRVRGNASVSGRSNYASRRFGASVSANRVTEDWKVSLSLSQSYSETEYDYPEIDYYELSLRRSHTFSGLLVKSVSPRWSAGLRASAQNATYYNFDFSGSIAPVLEYSVFPYEEATRRSLTFQYGIEGTYNDYQEETVFFKDHESFLSHSLGASLNFQRPWGNAFAAAEGAHHLDNIDLHHISFFTGISLRLGRGLTLTVHGDVSRVKDLITVAADAGDTVEEILLARRQLQTNYTYSTSFSLSYSFGSIFNNVVNPRLGGGGGIPIMIMY